jgi:hypothetical protein
MALSSVSLTNVKETEETEDIKSHRTSKKSLSIRKNCFYINDEKTDMILILESVEGILSPLRMVRSRW